MQRVLLFSLIGLSLLVGCTPPASSSSSSSSSSSTTASSTPEVSSATILSAANLPASQPALAARASEPLRVIVAGDLIPHRPALIAPESLTRALLPLQDLFAKADGVIANYEAATGPLEKKAFRLAYAAPPEWIAVLPQSGINAVTVANNHACDLDYDGVEATLNAAQKAGLTVVGGDMKSDPWAPRVLVEKGGKKVCAVAWTTFINAPGGCARTVRIAHAREDAAGRKQVAAAMQRARSSGCDATIAIMHGGEEYVRQTPAVMNVARQAAESGADAVVIHHPHIASPLTIHPTRDGRKIPIFQSIGNLVSNQGESWKPPMFPVLRQNRRLVCVNGWTRLGVLADLTFNFPSDGATGAAAAAAPKLDFSFHLLWTDNEHADDKKVPVPKIATRLLDREKDAAVIERLSDDEVGPVELFDDPCWVEGDRGELAAEKCTTTLARSAPPPPSTAASKSKSKKRK